MTCEKCCFWPCNNTNANCGPGTYYTRTVSGRLIKIVEVPDLLAEKLVNVLREAR